MKSKKSLIVLLFISMIFSCFSQEKTQNNETIIIQFQEKKPYQTKWIESKKEVPKKAQDIRYTFHFNLTDRVHLIYRRFEDFDEKERNNPELFLKINKSFLKKNKHIILTYKNMSELGYKKTLTLLRQAKHILLIDNEDIMGDKLILKKVHHFHLPIE